MKWFWKKMWLGLLEALEQWLKETGNGGTQTDHKPQSPNTTSFGRSVTPTKTVTEQKQQAHEILKGQR